MQGQYADVHGQVMGVPHMGLHPSQLQQLGYDPSMMQVSVILTFTVFWKPSLLLATV